MKRIMRLDENDVRELIATIYNVPVENVVTVLTEEPRGYNEEMTPVFYADVEMRGEKYEG